MNTYLCNLFNKYGSDKASDHTYSKYYYNIFKDMRNNNIRLFEVGIGTNNPDIPWSMGSNGLPGASLYAWRDFFLNGNIFSADIDKDILFTDDRIKTFYVNQKDKKTIKNLWKNKELEEKFDIIIDDGIHDFFSNILFFLNSIHKLKKGGYYIIEDVRNKYEYNANKYFGKFISNNPDYTYKFVKEKSEIKKYDNNLIVIKYL